MTAAAHTLPRAEEIRRLAGLDGREIAGYDPTRAVRRDNSSWSLTLVGGKTHPEPFRTRRAAIEMGIEHKRIKEGQFRNPEAWFSLESLLARDRLARVEEIRSRPGMGAAFENDLFAVAEREQARDREEWAREAGQRQAGEEEQGMRI